MFKILLILIAFHITLVLSFPKLYTGFRMDGKSRFLKKDYEDDQFEKAQEKQDSVNE